MKRTSKILIIVSLIFVAKIFVPSLRGTAASFFYGDVNNIEKMEEKLLEDNAQILKEKSEGDQQVLEEENNRNESVDEIEIEDEKMVDKEEKEASANEEGEKSNSRKKAFLTFDDGPTSLTPRILKVLSDHEVKATFFTLGKLVEKNPSIVQQAYEEGHGVLVHSYSHDYAIYSTFETFYEDLYRGEKALESALGFLPPPIFRFPGGSSNHSSFKYGGEQFMPALTEDVKEKGYYYIDWNVSSGDASPDYDDKEKMIKNIMEGAKNKDFIVILFHDVPKNEKMAQILPYIITELKKQGYDFRAFRDITDEEMNKMIEMKLANKPIVR